MCEVWVIRCPPSLNFTIGKKVREFSFLFWTYKSILLIGVVKYTKRLKYITQTSQMRFHMKNVAIASFYTSIFDLNTYFIPRKESFLVVWFHSLTTNSIEITSIREDIPWIRVTIGFFAQFHFVNTYLTQIDSFS